MDRRDYTDRVLSSLRRVTEKEREAIRSELDGHIEDHMEALRELGVDDALLERIARLVQRQSLLHRRLMAAFPHMQFPRSPASLEALRAAWDRLRRPRRKK